MKYLTVLALILNLLGCANSSSQLIQNNFVVKGASKQYGKYHFVLQTMNNISDMHNPFSKFYLITHYHIYTNSLGTISGDKILFSKYDNTSPKKLSKNSTFIFTSDSITIKGLQWCSNVTSHCHNILHGKYNIMEYSKLKVENNKEDKLMDEGYFK